MQSLIKNLGVKLKNETLMSMGISSIIRTHQIITIRGWIC